MPLSQIFNIANMSFYAIPKNKILAKTSEFTVAPDETAHAVSV